MKDRKKLAELVLKAVVSSEEFHVEGKNLDKEVKEILINIDSDKDPSLMAKSGFAVDIGRITILKKGKEEFIEGYGGHMVPTGIEAIYCSYFDDDMNFSEESDLIKYLYGMTNLLMEKYNDNLSRKFSSKIDRAAKEVFGVLLSGGIVNLTTTFRYSKSHDVYTLYAINDLNEEVEIGNSSVCAGDAFNDFLARALGLECFKHCEYDIFSEDNYFNNMFKEFLGLDLIRGTTYQLRLLNK